MIHLSKFLTIVCFQPTSVKRNLSQKLKSIRPKTQVFHLFNDVVPPITPLKRRASLVTTPVIPLEKNRIKDFEPPSPPKVRISACSKQSKRNLKRLTRQPVKIGFNQFTTFILVFNLLFLLSFLCVYQFLKLFFNFFSDKFRPELLRLMFF